MKKGTPEGPLFHVGHHPEVRTVNRSREMRSGVVCRVAELLLDAEHLVVLGDPVAAGGTTGLDLARTEGHGEVGDGGVLRFCLLYTSPSPRDA